MPRRPLGFTLLEVMIAVCVLTVGLLGLAGTLGPVARLAGQGRLRERAALVMVSRADQLRAQLLAAAPACAPPGSGSRQHPDGVVEMWAVSPIPAGVEVRIAVGADTLVTQFPCP